MQSANAINTFCIFIAAVMLAAWYLNRRKRRLLEATRQAELARRVADIEALTVPGAVLLRAVQLLRQKNVVLDERQQRYLVQGFRDYLIAVLYSRSGPPQRWRLGVAMTSDTVDMLWHAWLEDDDYEETFTGLLGFPLIHLPEAPEQVVAQRGPGNIDFLEQRPHRKAVATYRTLKAALPLAGRSVQSSGLYLLDALVKNRDGFYYTAAILMAFERANAAAARHLLSGQQLPGCRAAPQCRRRLEQFLLVLHRRRTLRPRESWRWRQPRRLELRQRLRWRRALTRPPIQPFGISAQIKNNG